MSRESKLQKRQIMDSVDRIVADCKETTYNPNRFEILQYVENIGSLITSYDSNFDKSAALSRIEHAKDMLRKTRGESLSHAEKNIIMSIMKEIKKIIR